MQPGKHQSNAHQKLAFLSSLKAGAVAAHGRLVAIMVWIHMLGAMVVLCATMSSFVFANPNMPVANIPYYDATWSSQTTTRWKAEHTLLVLTLPMFILPALTLATIFFNPWVKFLYALHYIMSTIACIFDAGMFVWSLVRVASCEDWAMCTNERVLGNPAKPNVYFVFLIIGYGAMGISTGLSIFMAKITKPTYDDALYSPVADKAY